jgi:restriction endonuclease Mrr
MTTQALENVARARLAHTEAATALDHVTQANSALLVRLAEARAKAEEAIRETKAKGDPDGKWAMQLRLSMDDHADIQVLLSGSQSALNERSAALSAATAAVQTAEFAARKEEAEIQASELDAVIAELDARLCQAVQARLACHLASNPRSVSRTSVFTLYTPSKMLKSICINGQVG